MHPQRIVAAAGWLALLGGGEFSFGETEAADAAWLAKLDSVPLHGVPLPGVPLPGVPLPGVPLPGAADGISGGEDQEPSAKEPGNEDDLSEEDIEARQLRPVGFLPTASGSQDYGEHFQVYLDEYFERPLDVIPVYRNRDARRGRNAERIRDEIAALYVGGGVPEQLLDVLRDSAVETAMRERLERGGIVAAIATAAQAFGVWTRGLRGGFLPGLGWLPGGVVETHFEPGRERRLRQLMQRPGVEWGLALTPGSAILIGPRSQEAPLVETPLVETIGAVYMLDSADAELRRLP